jgi:transcriptional regulator with XRE-family HTH domain
MDYLKLNIKYLRTLHGLTQANMAEILAVSRDNVASYERGTNLTVDLVHKIVNHFQVGFNDLMEKDLSLLDSKIGEPSINESDQKITESSNRLEMSSDFDNLTKTHKSKIIQSLERIIAAQEITIQTQKETIKALQEVIGKSR